MKFCEKLKEARTKAGLKQEELAKALGVPSEQSPTMSLANAIRKSTARTNNFDLVPLMGHLLC